ncbi:ABC transporter ATP-binding protein [Leeia sp. TBRC 13508]|uniref:ABC transporter ATP-binding protein n=1 Tax=Leeia speluncae TaxID=2884804 RepID=A0ABS8D2Y1_9NEIS|nr:ABC transporter ATP-binding protein [Leeia speluncae]MCB6182558.1 ABC transporter ATP-binding protein [Leeia speluncae]
MASVNLNITCENLSLIQHQRCLLRSLNLTFHEGEAWMILGENGVGKSTLLSVLAGWQASAFGVVKLADQVLHQINGKDRAKTLAWLPQQDEYPFPETVMERVLSGRHPYQSKWHLDSEFDYAIATDALKKLDLLPLKNQDLSTLSGGERRRTSLAAILSQQTKWLLLDEPMSQLDIRHQQQLISIFRACRENGQSIIAVGHEPNHAQAFASHVLLIGTDGSWQAGSVEEVLTAANLSKIYHTEIEAWEKNGERRFVPCLSR